MPENSRVSPVELVSHVVLVWAPMADKFYHFKFGPAQKKEMQAEIDYQRGIGNDVKVFRAVKGA